MSTENSQNQKPIRTPLVDAAIKFHLLTTLQLEVIEDLKDTTVNTKHVKKHSNMLVTALESEYLHQEIRRFYSTEEKSKESFRIMGVYRDIIDLVATVPFEYLESLRDGLKTSLVKVNVIPANDAENQSKEVA